jgi:hypothetical protein
MHRQRTCTPRILLVDPKTIYGVANHEVVAQTESPRQAGMDSVYEFIRQYTRDAKRQPRQELGTWTDLSNRAWYQYCDAETDCIVNRPNNTTMQGTTRQRGRDGF